MNTCERCNIEVIGNYCHNCGQPQKLERINSRYLLNEIGSVLNFQKGIFYTIRELLIRPGHNTRQFIARDRNRLVKPVLFILICSLVYSITVRLFHIEDGYITFAGNEQTAIKTLFDWVINNYGYSNIIMGLFASIWIKLFFRKHDYNIFEILILLCFVLGIGMLMYSVMGIIEGLTKFKMSSITGIVYLGYYSWAICQFFDNHRIMNYVKAIIAYLLGMISFAFAIIGLGLLIDQVK